jgi:alanyl-tRNA synthetase
VRCESRGIRRIEAVAGPAAVEWLQKQYETLDQIMSLLKASNLFN